MNIIAAVQARMGSSRLPNKVMASIGGVPMIAQVCLRTRLAETINHVVLSIPDTVANDALDYFARQAHIYCCRGAEEDLLARTIGTVEEHYRVDGVVRITGDCPLVDSKIIDQVVDVFTGGNYDYVSNVFPRRTYPAGIAVEVYSVDLLHHLDEAIQAPRYREYYMAWLWEHAQHYSTYNVELEQDLSSKRWTVDEMDDLLFVRAVYDELGLGDWGMAEVLDLLERKPEIEAINAHITIEPFKGLER